MGENTQEEESFIGAASNGKLEEVKELLEEGVDIDAKYWEKPYSDSYQRTALHFAANNRELEVVKFLISKGANIDAQDAQENTPLHLAADTKNKHTEILEYLISQKANLEIENKEKETPLFKAVRNDNFKVVGFLLSKGANINAKKEKGLTPIDAAAHGDDNKRTLSTLLIWKTTLLEKRCEEQQKEIDALRKKLNT